MKLIILAGGYVRKHKKSAQMTPKCMMEIGEKPILWHLMKSYSYYGINEFIICMGYEADTIKSYFLEYEADHKEVVVDLETGVTTVSICSQVCHWKVTLVDTGLNTLKGARLKQVAGYLTDETNLLTYGDFLTALNIRHFVDYHKEQGRVVTLSGAMASERFGKKRGASKRFVKGGYMVFDKTLLEYLTLDPGCDLGEALFKQLELQGELAVYKYEGTWARIGKLREIYGLDKLWQKGTAFWKVWNERMETTPFLSICIPTFNRADILKENLESIFSQIHNDYSFEIVVVNNNSEDHTEEVVKAYQEKYLNLVYKRNETNIGMRRNILFTIQQGTGQYCMLHGDDDCFQPNSLYQVIEYIKQAPQCGIYFINVLEDVNTWELHYGMNTFLEKVGVLATAITTSILRREDLNQIEKQDQFIQTNLNQIYLIYSILANNPHFAIINKCIIAYRTQPSGECYDWGEVFIKNYLSILEYFIPRGLDRENYNHAKKRLLDNFILVWYKMLKDMGLNIDFSNTLKYFDECYSEESYFEAYHDMLSQL